MGFCLKGTSNLLYYSCTNYQLITADGSVVIINALYGVRNILRLLEMKI
jgi:hypothetical protein